jgi:CheY-like chemotaxis protein
VDVGSELSGPSARGPRPAVEAGLSVLESPQVRIPAATAVANSEPPAVRARPSATSRKLLVLDPGGSATLAVRGLVGRDHGVDLHTVAGPEEVLAAVADSPPHCLLIGSGLTKTAVFTLLDELHQRAEFTRLPVVLRLDRRLTRRDEVRLRRYEPALLTRVAESDEALTAETALLLHPSHPGESTRIEYERTAEDTDGQPERLHGRILLVDDDVRNLFALASLLEDRGLEVVFSETGRDALDILAADPRIDLVLMDIMMPQMDGYETIREARAMEGIGELPIIAVTAKAMQGDREKAIEAGASDYITKPVDPDKLIALVGAWLGG